MAKTSTTGKKAQKEQAVTATEIAEQEAPDVVEDLNAIADVADLRRARENDPESWVTVEGYIYSKDPMRNRDGSENTAFPKYMLNGGLYKMSSGASRPGALRIEFPCRNMAEYDALLSHMERYVNQPLEVDVFKHVSDDGRWTNFKVKGIRIIDNIGRTIDGTLIGEQNIMGSRSQPSAQQETESSIEDIFS